MNPVSLSRICGRISFLLGLFPWVANPILLLNGTPYAVIGFLCLIMPAAAIVTGWIARRCWSGRLGLGLAAAMYVIVAIGMLRVNSARAELEQNLRRIELTDELAAERLRRVQESG